MVGVWGRTWGDNVLNATVCGIISGRPGDWLPVSGVPALGKQTTSSACKEMCDGVSSGNIFLNFTPFCESHIAIYSRACCGGLSGHIPSEIMEIKFV